MVGVVALVNFPPSTDSDGVNFLGMGSDRALRLAVRTRLVACKEGKRHDTLVVDGVADGSGSGLGVLKFTGFDAVAEKDFALRGGVVFGNVGVGKSSEEWNVDGVRVFSVAQFLK